MTSITEDTVRGEYIAGLRALADALEQNADVPTPDYGDSWSPIRWVIANEQPDEQKAVAQRIVRGLGGTWDKSGRDEFFVFTSKLRGLYVDVLARREAVCRRVVTGTRDVVERVPAPDAPMVEVTKTVEDVEWVCEPLLADHTAKAIDRILTAADA